MSYLFTKPGVLVNPDATTGKPPDKKSGEICGEEGIGTETTKEVETGAEKPQRKEKT
jgi:hypothetical protein